jgi:hypothetical protein
MAQDLTVNIKTTSDVPKAMDKAKAATVSFGKQVEDIQKKFSMAFKDIFLSFLGPMALLGIAINYIGKLIADNQRKQAEANQAAIDGTNELMSAEDRYYANKRNNENKAKENVEQAVLQRKVTVEEFLKTDPRGQEITRRQNELAGDLRTLGSVKTPKQIEEEVLAIIAEDAKRNPEAGMKPTQATNFKGPEGFGNVIGVGANPVIEAMTKQTEVLLEIKKVLENQAPGGGVPPPFTEKPLTMRNIFNA